MRYIDLTKLLLKRANWGNSQRLWTGSALKKDFSQASNDKCWYTEVSFAGQDVHIDHFRPKAEIKQYQQYNYNAPLAARGYYWLSNDPENYRACCVYANRVTHGGGKGNYFPLMQNSPLLTPGGNQQEIPMLLDPCDNADVNLISFMGNQVTCTSLNPTDQLRVTVSTKLYNLDNSIINAQRSRVWDDIAKTIQEYQSGDITQAACLRKLNDSIDRKAPFSACAIACINSLAPNEIKSQLNLTL